LKQHYQHLIEKPPELAHAVPALFHGLSPGGQPSQAGFDFIDGVFLLNIQAKKARTLEITAIIDVIEEYS